MEAFVPIASHLLKSFGVVNIAMEKSHKKKGPKDGEKKTLDSSVKAPEVDVMLRLNEAQLGESLALEAVGSSLCFLLYDHLGLLSKNPSFPEIVTPVMMHLRKHRKHCRSEPLRRQLQSLVEKVDLSVAQVRARREQLTEVPSAKKFLLFEPDTPIAKARAEALKRRVAEEKARVEAEIMDGPAKESSTAEVEDAGEEAKAKKGKKRKKDAAKEDPEAAKKKATEAAVKSARKQAKASGSLPDRDKVEDMGFESGADE